MCYFVEQNIPRRELEKRFGIRMPEDPRYTPGYFHSAFSRPFLPVITSDKPEEIQLFQWGLIPSWVKDEKTAERIRNSTFNARSETAWIKPSFRSAIKYKRCLVLIHGFYEYHSAGNQKIPYYIKLKNDRVFTLAGLFDTWINPSTGEFNNTFSVLTTKANPMMERIHNLKKRMPVILPFSDEKLWIKQDTDRLLINALLKPFPEDDMTAYTVSRRISSPDAYISDPALIEFYDYEK